MLEQTDKINKLPLVDSLSFQQKVDNIILKHCEFGGENTSKAVLYHLSSGGSRTRAKMAFGVAKSLAMSTQDSLKLAACIEALHNASLIHDDLQDKDTYRRSSPSLWAAFDKNTAVSAGDLMISASYGIVATISSVPLSSLVQLIHMRLSQTVEGQQQDLSLDSNDNLYLQDYITIAMNKSAPLFSLALELGFHCKNLTKQAEIASKSAYDFAIAYQLFDDYCDRDEDLRSSEKNAFNIIHKELNCYSEAKSILKDLIIKHLQSSHYQATTLSLKSSQVLLECINKLQCQIDQVF